MPAVVPGTVSLLRSAPLMLSASSSTFAWPACPKQVLSNLVHNGTYRDPNLGAVNLHIPDAFHAGRCFYTYWFSTNFSAPLDAGAGQRARLTFHGINYSAR